MTLEAIYEQIKSDPIVYGLVGALVVSTASWVYYSVKGRTTRKTQDINPGELEKTIDQERRSSVPQLDSLSEETPPDHGDEVPW